MSEYHPREVIERYRGLKGWTQHELADKRPKSDREEGVRVGYGDLEVVREAKEELRG
jgi:hypothetical protein